MNRIPTGPGCGAAHDRDVKSRVRCRGDKHKQVVELSQTKQDDDTLSRLRNDYERSKTKSH